MKRYFIGILLAGLFLAGCTVADPEAAATVESPTAAATMPATPSPIPTENAEEVEQAAAMNTAPAPTLGLTPTWTAVPRSGTSLRELADDRGIYVGTAVRSSVLFQDQEYMEIVAREFNLLTIEWELNFFPVNPEPGEYNFSRADPVFDFAEANDMLVHANTLVWYRQVAPWFEEGDYSREESIEILRNHITTLVSRYKGRVYAWDVVNEAVTDDGQLRNSVWLERIGPEYIELAFQFAHEADPDALLFYNDYGAEELNTKSDAIYELVRDLTERGVPIDGVGFQMHGGLDNRRDSAEVRENMERIGELGLEIHFSELDVGIRKGVGTTQQRLELQADVYEQYFNLCLEAENCTAFVVWGVADQHSWLREENPGESPLLFDDNYEPKLAYEALVQALEEAPAER